MNFDDVIKAHVAWKMKLAAYLANPDGSIDVDSLAKDNLCDLGKWIYGEGASFRNNPNFLKLVDSHKKFHEEAANIVRRKNKGEEVAKDIALGALSPFSKYSTEVVACIMECKNHCK
jgi:methyl-accepting chemotaxis protein